MPRSIFFLSNILILMIAQLAAATDVIREQQLAADLANRTSKDETVWLDAQGRKFNALFLESIPRESHGALILLHGDDASPDAANLLQPLRKRLPEKGWSTLSLQTPIREQGADPQQLSPLLPEAISRIEAAVAFLKTRKMDRLFILGHQRGGILGLRFLADKPAADIQGLAVIDLPATRNDQEDVLNPLGKIKVPVLDISISRKSQLSDDATLARKRVMKNNLGYRQILIADAHSSLRDAQELLTNHIHGWLMRLPPPTQPNETKSGP